MKITAAFALGFALIGLRTSLASGAEYPRAYLSDGQIWVQQTASEPPFQATHDCADKSIPAVSLDRKQIAYGVACVGNDQHISPMNLVVLDLSGNTIVRFSALPMKKLGSNCTPGGDLQWIDDHHIGINCAYNPSLEAHLVVNVQTGEIEKEYPGLWVHMVTGSQDCGIRWVYFALCSADLAKPLPALLMRGQSIREIVQTRQNRTMAVPPETFTRSLSRSVGRLIGGRSPSLKRYSIGILILLRPHYEAANRLGNATIL